MHLVLIYNLITNCKHINSILKINIRLNKLLRNNSICMLLGNIIMVRH